MYIYRSVIKSLLTSGCSSSCFQYCRIGCVEDLRKRHFESWLQPVLLVIDCVRRRLDHMERISEARVRTLVLLRLVQDTSVDEDKIPCIQFAINRSQLIRKRQREKTGMD